MIGGKDEGKKVTANGKPRVIREEDLNNEKPGGRLSGGTRIRDECEATIENNRWMFVRSG